MLMPGKKASSTFFLVFCETYTSQHVKIWLYTSVQAWCFLFCLLSFWTMSKQEILQDGNKFCFREIRNSKEFISIEKQGNFFFYFLKNSTFHIEWPSSISWSLSSITMYNVPTIQLFNHTLTYVCLFGCFYRSNLRQAVTNLCMWQHWWEIQHALQIIDSNLFSVLFDSQCVTFQNHLFHFAF